MNEIDISGNLFNVLGVQSREDCVSNALCYAFNKSPSFMRSFLKHICDKKDPERYELCKAHTRVSTGTPGIPDLVLTLEKPSSVEIVVIENKLNAEEGDNQTSRYSSKEAIESLWNNPKLELKKQKGETSFVFLTLFPDQLPKDSQYLKKQHSDLQKVAAEIPKWDDRLAQQLINDWLALTRKFYEKEQVSLSDNFFYNLKDDSGLDGGYMFFRSAMNNLDLPDGFEKPGLYRASEQGRHYYGAQFWKKDWQPGSMETGSHKLEPHHFQIHFEFQYSVLYDTLSYFLHYETNPYLTKKWVDKNVEKIQYETWRNRRKQFQNELMTKLPDWSFSPNRYNQLAKFDTRNFGKSYAEVKSSLEGLILRATPAIDSVLQGIESVGK